MQTEPTLGRWWEPSAPEHKLFGTLDQSDGLRLRLMGSFAGDRLGDEAIYALHGDVRGTESLATLLECSGGAFVDTTLEAAFLVAGAHLAEGWNTPVRMLSGSSDAASRWIGRHGGKQVLDFENVAATIEYRQPEPIAVRVNDLITLSVHFQPTFKSDWEGATEIGISQQAVFSLGFSAPVSLLNAVSYLETLNEWLTLLSGWSVYLGDLRVQFDEDLGESTRDPRGYPATDGRVQHPSYVEDEHWPRIRFAGIAGRAESLVSTWFARREQISPLVEHWRSISQSKLRMPLQYQFQALCAAVESAETAVRVKSGKQPRFKDQVIPFLTRSLPSKATPRDVDSLATSIVALRNWYTHFTHARKKGALTGAALANACHLMYEALEFELLRWCGLSPDDAYDLSGPSVVERLSRARDLSVWHEARFRGEPK